MGGPSVEWPGGVKGEALLRRDHVRVAEGGDFEEEGFGGDFWRGRRRNRNSGTGPGGGLYYH